MEVDFSNSSKEEVEIFYKNLSSNIKKLRLEKGFSQEKIALDIGIKSIAFYSNCENNRYNKRFNLEHIYKIAKALEVRLDKLFCF